MKPGEEILVARVYAVCAGLSGIIGAWLSATTTDVPSLNRVVLAVLSGFCLWGAFRAARQKP